jgi:hypothetical protein
MKEIKIYLDLEAIEKETGRKFDIEGEYSDNFLQWIEFLAHHLSTDNENFTKDQKEKANELHDILKNCYSDYEMERSIRR